MSFKDLNQENKYKALLSAVAWLRLALGGMWFPLTACLLWGSSKGLHLPSSV